MTKDDIGAQWRATPSGPNTLLSIFRSFSTLSKPRLFSFVFGGESRSPGDAIGLGLTLSLRRRLELMGQTQYRDKIAFTVLTAFLKRLLMLEINGLTIRDDDSRKLTSAVETAQNAQPH